MTATGLGTELSRDNVARAERTWARGVCWWYVQHPAVEANTAPEGRAEKLNGLDGKISAWETRDW